VSCISVVVVGGGTDVRSSSKEQTSTTMTKKKEGEIKNLGERKKEIFFSKRVLSFLPSKPEQHLYYLVLPAGPGDVQRREPLAVPRGEGAIARGELEFYF